MKFQVAKQDIQEAVEIVAGAMSLAAQDMAGHFLFRANPEDADEVEIVGYSQRLSATRSIKGAKILDAGPSFTVEGWRLKGLLQNLESDAVLVLSLNATEIKIEVQGYSDITLRSLDPADFPNWDKSYKDAKSVGRVNAIRLATALKQARGFASMDENTSPEAVVVNAIKGVMSATDKKSVMCHFKVRGLDEAGFRIHSKDIGTIVSFLEATQDDVEILETDRKVYFKRFSDGAVLGEGRFLTEVPAILAPPDLDSYTWKVKTADLRKALKFVFFGASKKDDRLYLAHPVEDGPIRISMKGESGKLTTVSVPCLEVTKDPAAPSLPEEGFPISMERAIILLDLLTGLEEITLGVNVVPEKKRRYVRVQHTMYADEKGENGDKYLFVMGGSVW